MLPSVLVNVRPLLATNRPNVGASSMLTDKSNVLVLVTASTDAVMLTELSSEVISTLGTDCGKSMSSNSTFNSPLGYWVIFLTVLVAEPLKFNSFCLSFFFANELSIPLMSS